jgi:transcriptional regulator with XRE-family HTH domain
MSRDKDTSRTVAGANLKAVGRRLRELRGFDTTQEEFANQLGISQSQLSKYERGVAAPPADVLLRVKEKLRVSIDWLLTGNDGEDNSR